MERLSLEAIWEKQAYDMPAPLMDQSLFGAHFEPHRTT